MDQEPVLALEAPLQAAVCTGAWVQTIRNVGHIQVAVGQAVDAATPLGQTQECGALLVVDVTGPLGIAPTRLAAVACVSPGQRVVRGEPLAEQKSLIRRRVVAAPCDGAVQSLVAGCVLLRQAAPAQPALPEMAARVSAISERGEITLQISGTQVWCAWGRGEGSGLLVKATDDGAQELGWEHIGRHLAGTILLGGWLRDWRALQRAQQFGIAGLIVGGIDAALARRAHPDLPVLATEGIGALAMAPTTFAALARLAGHTTLLRGAERQGAPHLAIAHPTAEHGAPVAQARRGARVHLVRMPYLGQIGQIIDLPETAQRTALGTLCEGALVALSTGQRVFVPWANLELVA